jgi:hypothetical protein
MAGLVDFAEARADSLVAAGAAGSMEEAEAVDSMVEAEAVDSMVAGAAGFMGAAEVGFMVGVAAAAAGDKPQGF